MSQAQPSAAAAGYREVGGASGYILHGFASHGMGSVNTYWIETPRAVIVFDAQRQISQAREALAAITRLKKPIEAIFISHEHPDHVGGLEIFAAAAPGAPIYASDETRSGIVADRFGYYALARAVLGDDFPTIATQPTHHIAHGAVVEIDGLSLHVHEFGPGEAPSMTLLGIDDEADLLAADIVANRMTPFVLDGHVLTWIDRLSRFAASFPMVKRAHPGHGASDDAHALLDAQILYLTGFRDLVAEAVDRTGALSETARNHVVAAVERLYPGYPPVAEIPGLLAMSADAIARELAARQKATAD